jgi:biopolymer transport protein ExbB
MNKGAYLIKWLMVLFLMALLFRSDSSFGQDKKEADSSLEAQTQAETVKNNNDVPAEGNARKSMSLFDLIKKGGIIGYLIILLSFVAMALVIDYAMTIRRTKLAPPGDISLLRSLIKDKKFDDINRMDKEKTSFFSHIVIAGIREASLGYEAMIKAMEDTSEALSARIARKIEHLNVIGNIAPMLGLLGTVTGMLRCFNEISQVTGAIEPKQLAAGIFEALVTTCLGLIVAIPALYFYAIFRNRIDEFIGELSITAEETIVSFKPDNRGKQ